jgi:two-component system, chemotaxis family, CheB/CheR fusion protein
MPLEAGEEFEQLLEFLRMSRGFDFTGYKRATLVRRIAKRAAQLGMDDFGGYLDYLQVHPDEFPILFDTILINVTEFFRDRAAWDYIAAEVVPRLAAKRMSEPIRVWSAGCASGEEAYSAAMLLCEALGGEAYAERVKVYATDVDEDALAHARNGYPPEAIAAVPDDLVKKYFDVQAGRYSFRPGLRRTIIFGRHDLMQDAPIGRIDLLICRNTLMYFTAESQERILGRFHYAINEEGFLFLGRAEMLLTHAGLFRPVELRHRVFAKVPRVQLRDRVALLAQPGEDAAMTQSEAVQLRDLAADQIPLPQLIVDSEQRLVAASRQARAAFGLQVSDVGRPLKDLEISYRPAELRSRVESALKQHHAGLIHGVEHRRPDGSTGVYDISVVPLLGEAGRLVGASVAFLDVSEERRLEAEVERVRHEIETANEELQASNEELETTNEELQSTVEELETTNEELQSTNEELETMNEELESTNAELQTINADLGNRTDEVDRLNTFLEAILTSLQVGIAVLDRDFNVVLWNAHAHELWGLREEEATGRNFFNLDIGLPRDELRAKIQGVTRGEARGPDTFAITATNRRGREIGCRVTVTPLSIVSMSGEGAVVVMEEVPAGKPVRSRTLDPLRE